MTDYTFSKHALDMMEERNILETWARRALDESDNTFSGDDGNLHFSKAIVEKEDRILHVIVNSAVSPQIIVTLFFDRRLRRVA